MRRLVFLLAAAFLLRFPLAHFSFWLSWEIGQTQGIRGLYSHVLDTYYCTDEVSCWHERGHQLDAHRGYPSLDMFPVALQCGRRVSVSVTVTEEDNPLEAYASMYAAWKVPPEEYINHSCYERS